MAVSKDEETYFMEGNQLEIARLAYQHQFVKLHIGKLILAPIDLFKSELKILDSATADGLWLRDVQTDLQSDPRFSAQVEHNFIGTDIVESYFPPESKGSPDIELLVQSITKPWREDWKGTFDLVHQRFALPAAGKEGIRDALRGLIRLVKPGGWIQLVESDHSAFVGPAMGEMFELVKEVFGAMGAPHDLAQKIRTMLEEEGLEQVEERVYDVPLGTKNPDAKMNQKSVQAFTWALSGLVGAVKNIPNCSVSPETLETLGSRVTKELTEEGGILRVYVIWARMPFR
ncbi:hypothetical protein BCR34DRAFT_645720 [Clohesyomyces aquaticus]|uniref:Methyltransferase SirN-like protein n=1 Tax=Clohesyomyces aquaticus TaxID=1231657 RepID=A0A1Y1ZWM4_9PLEO|nr:hypothetical protein BCR34DRAFT_645720 [Clohesyomyces aquaticus]